MTYYGMKYIFVQFGSAVLAAYPPNHLPITSLLTEATEKETENALTLCKHFLAVPKNITVLSVLFWLKIQNMSPYWLLRRKGNSIPTRPTTEPYKLPKALEPVWLHVSLRVQSHHVNSSVMTGIPYVHICRESVCYFNEFLGFAEVMPLQMTFYVFVITIFIASVNNIPDNSVSEV